MKWIKWLWPVVALLAIAVYYVVDTVVVIPFHSIDHHRFIWPRGRVGVAMQLFAYGSMITIAVVVASGAIVAAYLYLRQNKPLHQDSTPQDS